MRYARWTTQRVPGAATPTLRLELRAGRKGTGQRIGNAVEVWSGSPRSWDAAGAYQDAAETHARDMGYAILDEDGEEWIEFPYEKRRPAATR